MKRFYFIGWVLLGAGLSSGQLKTIASTDYQDILRSGGDSLVVVNFWATWCEPCVEEFPSLLKIKSSYPVRLIFISVDDWDRQKDVENFLSQRGVNFPTYIRSEEDMELFINGISKDWSGAVPATFIYTSGGKLIRKVVGLQSYEQFKTLIKR